jgi:hypothetical protein
MKRGAYLDALALLVLRDAEALAQQPDKVEEVLCHGRGGDRSVSPDCVEHWYDGGWRCL